MRILGEINLDSNHLELQDYAQNIPVQSSHKSAIIRRLWSLFSLFLLIILTSNYTYSASYHFSSSIGNDAHTALQARNPNTPWKSLDKLNAIFHSLLPGDSILFKRGDTFTGSIIASKSGTASSPITFSAYGTGKQPQLNGLVKLNSWTSLGNGIYESPCNTSYGNILLINGTQQAIGRYPNKGYLTFESHNNNTSITDNELGSSQNWTGAEVVIRKDRWTLDKSLITSHSGGTLSYTSGTNATPNDGYGYFIQKHPQTLDQFGEWYYDSTRKMMRVFFGSSNPSAYVVQVSATNTLVSIQDQSFISFQHIAFIGAGKNAFKVSSASDIKLDNCTIDYTGDEAVLASWSPNFTIQNSLINHSLSGGLIFDKGCHNVSIINNQIKNTALLAGLGRSGTGTYEAVSSFGDNARIEKNTIDSTGYNGIYFGGNSSLVKNNFISAFCIVKDDGAGVYIGDWAKWYDKKIVDNIIINGIGAGEGTNTPAIGMAEGIYIDDLSESVTISGNTISQCSNSGIKIHNAKDINIFKNTSYNNGVQLRLEQDHYNPQSTYIRNNIVRNNIFFAKTEAQNTSVVSTHQDDIKDFGQLDSNSYSKPINDLAGIETSLVRSGKHLKMAYDLPDWKAAYGKDQSSTKSPLAIPAYKTSQLLSSTKIANGKFDSNISNAFWYSTTNDCTGSHSRGVLDGGSLKLSFNLAAANHVIVDMKAGTITANKSYILKFTILGTVANSSFRTYLRTSANPYTEISDSKSSRINTVATSYEVLLSSKSSIAEASVIFDIQQPAGQIYIDNVELYEAEISSTKPDDFFLFEYNATNSVKTISLNRSYVDVRNNTRTKSISLAPYTSIVLIAKDSPLEKEHQTIVFANLPTTVHENTPLRINATSSAGLPVNLKVVSGPGRLSGNVLSFTGGGTVTLQATQTGNAKFAPATETVQIFNIVASLEEPKELAASLSHLKAYPNPFVSRLTLDFRIPTAGKASLALYNSQGKLLDELFSGHVEANQQQSVTLNAADLGLPNGIYLIRLVSGKEVLHRKVILYR